MQTVSLKACCLCNFLHFCAMGSTLSKTPTTKTNNKNLYAYDDTSQTNDHDNFNDNATTTMGSTALVYGRSCDRHSVSPPHHFPIISLVCCCCCCFFFLRCRSFLLLSFCRLVLCFRRFYVSLPLTLIVARPAVAVVVAAAPMEACHVGTPLLLLPLLLPLWREVSQAGCSSTS